MSVRKNSIVLMIVVMFLFAALLVSCADDDCPTCANQDRTVVYLLSGYSAFGGPDLGGYTLEAVFMGEPIPNIDYFAVGDSSLQMLDPDAVLRFFAFNADSAIRSASVTIRTADHELLREVVIPDSFAVLTPDYYTVAPDSQPLMVDWEDANGADWYQFAFDITTATAGHPVDTTFSLTESFYIVPDSLLRLGDFLDIQISACKGPILESGHPGNIDEPGFVGYCGGRWKVRTLSLNIEHVKSKR